MGKKSTFGLGRSQLAALFAVCSQEAPGASPTSDDSKIANLLEKKLKYRLPDAPPSIESVMAAMRHPGPSLTSIGDRSIGEVLLNPQGDLELVQTIKNCAKIVAHESDCETETAVAITIYYAAIASFLVHSGKKITQHPYETLEESFTLLIDNGWLSSKLANLFDQARYLCLDKSGKRT